jgi:hypothetical protein
MVCLLDNDISNDVLIEGYLANKWGITSKLPMSHKYRKTEPTFDDIGQPSQFRPIQATGGMITEYMENGRKWRAHTFTDTSPTGHQFMVTDVGQPNFTRVILGSGGGSGGSTNLSNYPGGGGGAGGFISHWQYPIEAKEYTVYVGVGGRSPIGTEAPQPGGWSYIEGMADYSRSNTPAGTGVEPGGGGACTNGDYAPMTTGGFASPGGYSARQGNVGNNAPLPAHPYGLSLPHYTPNVYRLGSAAGYPMDNVPGGGGNYPGIATGGGGYGGAGEPTGSGTAGAPTYNPPIRSSHGGGWSGIPAWNGLSALFGAGGSGGCSDVSKRAVPPAGWSFLADGGIGSTQEAQPGLNMLGSGGGGAGNNPATFCPGGDGGSGIVIISYPLEEPYT